MKRCALRILYDDIAHISQLQCNCYTHLPLQTHISVYLRVTQESISVFCSHQLEEKKLFFFELRGAQESISVFRSHQLERKKLFFF